MLLTFKSAFLLKIFQICITNKRSLSYVITSFDNSHHQITFNKKKYNCKKCVKYI